MSENLVVQLRSGRNGLASDWTHYLPKDSRVSEGFREPVSLVVKGAVRVAGQPPASADYPMKVYVGENPGWGDTGGVIEAFTQLWPEVLQFLGGLGRDAASLVYFSAPATHGELYDLWPYMPFGIGDERRFFVSEVCKSSRARISACGWLCVEYAYENFKRMAGPDGFGFPYGTTIMGISVGEAKAAEYLRMDFLDKNALEKALRDNQVRCWWFCDTDFEGMTIWHKDLEAVELLQGLLNALRAPAQQLGLALKGAEE
jgi:hypothetical protein